MHRRIAFIGLLASLLIQAAAATRAAAPAPTRYVVTQGALAGSQVLVLPDGRAELAEAFGGGGVAHSSDGGVTWYYTALDGTVNPLRSAVEVPGYARELSDVVTGLAQLLLGSGNASPRTAARAAAAHLATAAGAWRASTGQATGAAASDQLAALAETLERTADTATDGPVVTALQDALPRLRALAAAALLQPRDGTVTISPTTLDLGSVPVGNAVSGMVSITNLAQTEQKVSVNVLGLTAPFSGGISRDVTLEHGKYTYVTITFEPTAQGPFSSTFVVTNALLPGGSATVIVKGTGVAPVIQATPKPVDFGKVAVGNFKRIEFEVKNLSAAQADISTQLNLSKPFSFGAVGDVNGTFPANGKGSINISFTPKKVGRFTGTITIRTSASTGTMTVPVVGVATGLYSADVETLDFGDVKMGTEARKQVVVTNNSDVEQPLVIKAPDAPFTIGTVPATVPANGTVTIPVTFTPSKTGAASSAFEVSTGKKNTILTIHTKGNGIENTSIHFSTTSVAFGMVPHGTGKTQSFTISNNTKTPLNVTLDRTALPTTFFALETPLTFTIAAGGSFDVTIFFEANAKCTHKGKLIVTINGQTFVVNVSAAAD